MARRPTRFLVLVALAQLGACAPPPDTEVRDPWTEGPEMPGGRRRLEPGVAAYGMRVAVVGGYATSMDEGLAITHEVLAYDTLAGAWGRLPDLPVAWTHANVAGAGGSLYVLGGLEGEAADVARGDAFVLDPDPAHPDLTQVDPAESHRWTRLRAMPVARGAAGVVASPAGIFVLGGATSDGATGSCLVFEVASRTWEVLPDLPIARSHPAAMRMADGTLIVAGGVGSLGLPLSDVWALRPGAAAWEPRELMNVPRGGCAYGVALGQLVCAGGEARVDASPAVETYSPLLGEWTQYDDMPIVRAGTQGAVVGQKLYIPGGAPAIVYEPTGTLLVFSLIDTVPKTP